MGGRWPLPLAQTEPSFHTVQIKEQRRRECCLPTAVKYPVVSINGPLLCGQEGLVPFHDHCIEVTLRLLSSVFCPAYSNIIQSSCGWFLSSRLSDKMWWEWKWQSLKKLCSHECFPKSKVRFFFFFANDSLVGPKYLYFYYILSSSRRFSIGLLPFGEPDTSFQSFSI